MKHRNYLIVILGIILSGSIRCGHAGVILENGKLYKLTQTNKVEIFVSHSRTTSFLEIGNDIIYATLTSPYDKPTDIKLFRGDITTGQINATQSLNNYSLNGKMTSLWEFPAPNLILPFSHNYSLLISSNVKSEDAYDGSLAIIDNTSLEIQGIIKGQYISIVRTARSLPRIVSVSSLLSHKGTGIDGFVYGPPIIYLWGAQLQDSSRLSSSHPAETSPCIIFPTEVLRPTIETIAKPRPNLRLITPPIWNESGDKIGFLSYDPKTRSAYANIVDLRNSSDFVSKTNVFKISTPPLLVENIISTEMSEGIDEIMHHPPVKLSWKGTHLSGSYNGLQLSDLP